MNKWQSLADFDLQSRSVINMLVYLFKRRDKKVSYSAKSRWKKTELQVFLAKATPCYILMSLLTEAFFIFSLTWCKDLLQSLIQMSDPVN